MNTCQTINSTPEINDIMVDGYDNVGTLIPPKNGCVEN